MCVPGSYNEDAEILELAFKLFLTEQSKMKIIAISRFTMKSHALTSFRSPGCILIFGIKYVGRQSWLPIQEIWIYLLRPHWTHCTTTVIRYPLVSKPFGAPDEAI